MNRSLQTHIDDKLDVLWHIIYIIYTLILFLLYSCNMFGNKILLCSLYDAEGVKLMSYPSR